MKKVIATGVSALVLALSPAAFAADYGETMMMTDPGFDWDGFYMGLIGEGQTDFVGGNWVAGGAAAGVIFSLTDDFKVDIEGAVMAFTGTSTGIQGEGTTRLGYAIDNVMLYGLGGIGTDGAGYFSYGAGMWFAATDQVSFRVEVDGNSYFGSGIVDWAAVNAGFFLHL